MLFKRKKPDVSRTQALSAKPIKLIDSPVLEDRKLKVKLKSPGWSGWVFRLPEAASKTFEFDELGLLVWENCDGKTSVQQIIRKLAKRYNLNLREAEVATVRFLEMLTKKQLIGMSVAKKTE